MPAFSGAVFVGVRLVVSLDKTVQEKAGTECPSAFSGEFFEGFQVWSVTEACKAEMTLPRIHHKPIATFGFGSFICLLLGNFHPKSFDSLSTFIVKLWYDEGIRRE
ncbi:MAG: hypothetical protein ABJZ55_00005 [Fuerstiella sp.]